MLIISARKNFWDSNRLTSKKKDPIRDVDLDTLDGQPIRRKELIETIEDEKVLLLIHGYNTEAEDLARAYQIIENHHGNEIAHYDHVVGYAWPAGDDPTDYFSAKNRAGAVSRRARASVELLLAHCREVGIMSHSMGCRVTLLVLNELADQGFQRQAKLTNFFTASAVDNEAIEQDERYFHGSRYPDAAIVFHSRHDQVLSIAYRAAEWDRALGYSGPEDPAAIDPKVRIVNCKQRVSAHGAYKRTPEVFRHIRAELSGTQFPQFVTL